MSNLFGKLLVELRYKADVSQAQLAKHLGYSRPAISTIETGTRSKLKPESIPKAAELLKVSPEVLYKAANYCPCCKGTGQAKENK